MNGPPRKQDLPDTGPMGLFSADLFRNFGIGFAIGAMLVVAQASTANWGPIAPAVATILPL